VNRHVLDTSAVIRLYVPDGPIPEGTKAAVDDAARGDALLFAPELLLAETAQVLLKKERAGQLREAEVREIVSAIEALPITFRPHRPLIAEASRLARAHGLTIYDALYLALARSVRGGLLTADARLRAAIDGNQS
jgi:predicted nucleic acid-binding protein